MTDIPRIWTQPFAAKMVETLNGDAKFRSAVGSMSERVQLRCLDTPDKTDVAATYFLSGGVVKLEAWDEQPSPSGFRADTLDKKRFLARTTAPYSIWVKLDKGEMGVIDAIISPHYKFEGAKLRVLKNLRVFLRISEVAQSLESRYE